MLMRSPARWTRPTRRAPPGFILPAQPVLALKPPIGPGWLFAVKHDGFRIVSRKDGVSVHLWSRNGGTGPWSSARACFHAFDLLALDGVDLRHLPFSGRCAKLALMLAGAPEAINLCEHRA